VNAVIIVYKKKSSDSKTRFRLTQSGIKHGQQGWARVQGVNERVLLFYNAYLPEDTNWFDRWMPIEELRKIEKPKPAEYPEEIFPLSSVRHGFVRNAGLTPAEINDNPEALRKRLALASNVPSEVLPPYPPASPLPA
jgi:hypothetical protein